MQSNFQNWWKCAAAVMAVLSLAGISAVTALSDGKTPGPLLEKPEQTLSVDETLGVVFNPEVGLSPRKYYARANPKAEEALYRILDNDELKEFHSHAWEILGYIGGDSHAQRVEQKIEEYKSISRLLTPAERDSLQALFNSLGVMCGRKIDAACDVAEKMMDPAYWHDAKFRLSADPSKIEYQAISYLLFGYSLSLDPEIEKHARPILQNIDDPSERENLRQAFNRELLLGHGRNTRANEEERVTHEERRKLASFFNGSLKAPGPASHRPGD